MSILVFYRIDKLTLFIVQQTLGRLYLTLRTFDLIGWPYMKVGKDSAINKAKIMFILIILINNCLFNAKLVDSDSNLQNQDYNISEYPMSDASF